LHNTISKFIQFSRPIQNDDEYQKTIELTPWWIDVAYLKNRAPLPINSSPGLTFPKWNYSGVDGQILIAAKVIQSAVRFYEKIINLKRLIDIAKKSNGYHLDMSQYQLIFGTTRIPACAKDKICYGKEKKSNHIIVIRNGHLFQLPIFNSSGKVLGIQQLIDEIKENILPLSSESNPYPICVMTSEGRDAWAEVYNRIKEVNADAIKIIEDSLFTLCLDNKMQIGDQSSDLDIQASQCLHGGGIRNNSANRWFDKTIQFVIGTDGYCGVTYEHTPAEAPPIANLMDFICDEMFILLYYYKKKSSQALIFGINKMAVDTFDKFGKNTIKNHGISPDSFIQIAMQTAYYRIHRKLAIVYETASLRRFTEGRTEIIRSPCFMTSMFITDFVNSDDEADHNLLIEMLRGAIQQHKKYNIEVGDGMDRHLLAMRLICQEKDIEVPRILETDIYKRMMHFTLSTSQVPSRNEIQVAFGPSARDCYGICYNPRPNELQFAITTFKDNEMTKSEEFIKELGLVLNDLNNLLNRNEKP
uniref:Carn_acyltransf domain-containing protein n=1 Tax=Dracunculus medinensis TaxID=318479 RepID=A0A0N4UKZ6_DRAME